MLQNLLLHRAKIVDVFVLLGIGIFSFWLMWSTFRLQEDHIFMGSKLYSDFGAHLPLIRSFSMGDNIPPEYPFFAGQPIRYHYLFYLVVGYLERFGVPLDWAINTISASGMVLLLGMVYTTTLLFFRTRWAAILAVMLVVLNGSLSFVEIIPETWSFITVQETVRQVMTAIDFASFGPWDGKQVSAFWTWNVYTNQRHLGLSYGLVLAILYPLFAHTISQKKYLRWYQSAAIMLGCLLFPLLHQAGSVILFGIGAGWLVWYWLRIDWHYRLTYGLSLLALIAVTILFASQGGAQDIVVQLGFLAPLTSLTGILTYWWFNLGLYFVLLPMLLIRSRKKMGILLALGFGLFAAANVFRLSTDMINNHKFIHFFWLLVQIAAAGWIATTWQQKKWFRPLLVVMIFFLTFSGVVDAFPVINDRPARVENVAGSDAQQWIIANTPAKSQFLSTTFLYNPASLVGRQLYLDYGYHAWSMGYDDHHKRSLLSEFFSSEISQDDWCLLASQENINFVIISPGSDDFQGAAALENSFIGQVNPTYVSADGFTLIAVSELCSN